MRSSLRVAAIVSSLALLAFGGCATDEGDLGAPPAAPPTDGALGLVSQVDVTSTWLGKDDQVVVHWSLTNHGRSTLSLPYWQVPSATLEENVFAIARDGEAVRYVGKLVKRAQPTAADLVDLAPGETIAADVELSSFYQMGRAGEYAIAHDTVRLAVVSAGVTKLAALRSNQVATLRAEENPDADAIAPDVHADVVASGFRSCSSSQKTKITTALNSAQSYALNAESYLNAGTHNLRYTTWFGTYSSSRFSTVRSHYTNIRNTVQNKTMTFDCSCTDSAYAYVYPNSPYVVYLCNAFWSAPNTGTDSKAGTIIHETSHFTVVAGTDDHQYGQSGCRSLARSSPTNAIDNADSHEYFAENTPAQN